MSFQDIRGQEKPIQILKEYIKQARLAGSYLFIGPQNTGKALVAQTLAKAVNCQTQGTDSCDACNSCLKIKKNQHPDVHFIGEPGSDSLKIEEIRGLQKEINLKPYEARKKVFILSDAEKLTAEASNALLKVLEEPPANSLIILVSSKPAILFKTIVSRCQIVRFQALKRQGLEEILKRDNHLDGDTAHYLAYFCEGRIGRALGLAGQDTLREKNRIINEFIPTLRSEQKRVGRDSASKGQEEKEPRAFSPGGSIFSRPQARSVPGAPEKESLKICLNILASWFRDLYFVKVGMPHAQLVNIDRKPDLLKSINQYAFRDLESILNSISNSLLYLDQNINVKLLVSNLRIKLWKG
jgi:DNA polymerase-3 subunit delta'